MKHIVFSLPAGAAAAWTTLAQTRTQELLAKTSSQERSEFLRNKSDWRQLKMWMVAANDDKCWYCEAKSRRAPLEVDHFRPKLGTTVDRVKLPTHDGYYWLAYHWENFRLACTRCNRHEIEEPGTLTGKQNEFPLRDEAQRCSSPNGSYTNEEPRFLDPSDSGDVQLLAYGLDGEVKPLAPKGSWEYERARYTINTLGFNSRGVPEERRKQWQTLSTLIQCGEVGAASTRIQECLKPYLRPDQEYSSFFRSLIGTHKDKEWIEALL